MAVNYYFISSPLHLMFSANQAIQNLNDRNIAVINSYLPKNFKLFENAVVNNPQVFSDIVRFEQPERQGKYKIRKQRMAILRKALQAEPPDRIYTGSDRSVEFQYAMHVGKKLNPGLEGIYIDEGTQTYLGHKHMYKLQHRVIDPALKKIIYGRWWKNPLLIGQSGWIDTIYASFPSKVHPLLSGKKILQIELDAINTAGFQRFADSLLNQQGFDGNSLKDVRCIFILTNDSYYEDFWPHFEAVLTLLRMKYRDGQIAVKAHPRSGFHDELRNCFPELVHLDNRIGMEFILPKIHQDAEFVGDVSSALFTMKWFRPSAEVLAVKLEQSSTAHMDNALQDLFGFAGVRVIEMDELKERMRT